ncbi:MAG: hypothetical protein RMJ35_13925, partial [Phycisphaerales bacterium]|nr:hypothetical protein [Phycisphaerales bacterium]
MCARPWFASLSSFLAACLVFGICLRNQPVYDDVFLLEQDRRVSQPALWGRYWTESYNDGVDNLYRPLVSMSLAVQKWLHPRVDWPFFLVNILLHAGCAAAVAELTRRLAARWPLVPASAAPTPPGPAGGFPDRAGLLA